MGGNQANVSAAPTTAPVAEEPKKVEVAAPKKPRTFVDESDIFDFSGLQPKTDGGL